MAADGVTTTSRHALARVSGAIAIALASPTAAQLYDPWKDPSPLQLLQAPDDGVAYYRKLTKARALYRDRQFARAEPLLEQLTREYARDPFVWMMLGETRYELAKGLEAAAAWQKAGQLIGWDLEFANGYRMAMGYLKAGNKQAALAQLRWMIEEKHGYYRHSLIDHPRLAELRDDPGFLELIGVVDTSNLSREQGWAHDVDHLYNEIKRVNPDYRDKPFPPAFERQYAELKRNIPALSDEEIFVGMQNMLAVLRQGHVMLMPDERARTPSRFLPLRLYAFPDGIYVIHATDEFKPLVGSRVVRFGSLPAHEAHRRIAAATSVDGDMQYVGAASFLAMTHFLKGLGASPSADAIELTLQLPQGGQQRVTVPTMERPLEGPGRPFMLAPPATAATPLYLENMQANFWYRELPDENAFYVQVNRLRNAEGQTLEQFGDELWKQLSNTSQKNLIVDLRHNPGGTTQLYPSLLRSIIAFSRIPGNQVYVLISRVTYSAAGNLVTDLERLADPIFVGEATSECCNLYGDPTLVLLPYSGISGELTAVKWNLSTPSDKRKEMSPEVPVQLTASDFFGGRDPVLAAVFRLID